MSSQGRMAVDFLLQERASASWTPPSSSSSELSDVPPSSVFNSSDSNSNPTIGIMELANAAEMASAAEQHHTRVPYSPVSSNSNTSVEDQIDRFNSLRLRQHPQPSTNSSPPVSQPPFPQLHSSPQQQQQATSQPLVASNNRTSSRQNTCTTCNATFNQKIRFLHHLISVHGIQMYESRPILPCDKCKSAFLRNTDRSKHDACVHQRLRPFACDAPNCSSSFFFAKDLSKHRSTVHLRFKPFPCTICKKAFGKREHMTSHVKRVHQKLRPFKCDVCGIRLASKYNLQGHLKTAAHAAAQTLANREAGRS